LAPAGNWPRLVEPLSSFVRRARIPFFNTQMGKGAVTGGSDLYLGTAALSERDHIHRAIGRTDLIVAIGHDTVEKPPFLMGGLAGGPKVIYVGYVSANVEQVFYPDAELIGDIGASVAALADRLDGVRVLFGGELQPRIRRRHPSRLQVRFSGLFRHRKTGRVEPAIFVVTHCPFSVVAVVSDAV
jgi:thiamine pyrophosphate-dependent acetolactate synthase large subunit-like protein